MRWLNRILVVLGVTLAIASVAFLIWTLWIPAPMPEALAALASDDQVLVSDEQWLVFTPVTQPVNSGLILYPGSRVDPRAYAPQAHAIAAAGHLVVIVSMPLNQAVFAPNRAEAVIAAYPAIERWAIGGHSLGGAMAVTFVANHPGAIAALVLWAAYPSPQNSIAHRTDLVASSIYGTKDGVATVEEIEASRPYLPTTTTFVPIAGGNHAQFGWYGPQRGDQPATISREEQQAQAVAATLATLAQ